ncbi:DUF3883 domain-containing protein [Urechidicola vernalis]|uniref:DUF3883 domain-containing protein n=1 Tax=Urechidicola vernalis TaxID=3075600 RepID=A0ABU2Y1U4_9FLAO|nr:DUF3883 domain-containing protein [Urechidicola sp. P050]MDT0552121.1 DUF3883 domain-containing protein [Urechidicola sp. P050]
MNLKKTANKLFEDSKRTPIRGLSAIAEAEKYLQQAYEGRYFFELIQNVRDANKEINQDGEIYIELKENVLSISNTGAEFSAKGIEGITTIGESTKQSQEYIGFKGIGFKSIQEISQSPCIQTKYGSIYFDRKLTLKKYNGTNLKEEKTPLFYFPHFKDQKLSNSEIKNNIVTKIKLPLKENISENQIIEAFSEIRPKQLILLGNIRLLHFKSLTKFSLSKNLKKHIIEVRENELLINKYKYFSPNKKITIPEEILSSLEGKEKEIFESNSEIDINIVLELTESNRIKIIDEAKLYLYYPLQISSGFRFIIHSYFIVNPERTALRDSKLNDFLLSSIGHFIATEVLRKLKKTRSNTTSIFCFKRNEDAKINHLYNSLVYELKNQKFIYDNRNKKYFRPDDVIVADGFDKGLFPNGILGGKQLIFTDDNEVIEWLRNEFAVKYLTFQDISNEIERECKRQAKLKNINFFQNLYNYVSAHEGLNIIGKKVLLTSNWRLVSSEEYVFYGGGKRKPLKLSLSIKKQIHFIHKEIIIRDFREGRSRTGIAEFNTYELVRRLLGLFDKVHVPNSDLLNALYNLYPFDSKSELEIKEKIILPIKNSKDWLSPLFNPIYFETNNLLKLYPDGKFIDSEKLKWEGTKSSQVCKQDFLKTFGVWEIPAIYISETELVKSNGNREKLLVNLSGLVSRPFYIKNDRVLDLPIKYNHWFTNSVLNNWSIYNSFITSSIIPDLKYFNNQSYTRNTNGQQSILLSGFIESLREESWIVFSGEESSFQIVKIIGINLLDYSQGHNQVIGRFIKLFPINYYNNKDFIKAIGLLHFDGDSIDDFIQILDFIHKKYETNIPEEKDFINFYNRVLGKLVDFYFINNQTDSVSDLENEYFLSIDETTKVRYWKKAKQVYYIDDKANYDILPIAIKEKVQPHFTKRDKNTFGKIAARIGRRFSNSINKELIESEITQTSTLLNYLEYLPECLAILESSLDSNIDGFFEKIAQIRIFVCSKLEIKILVDGSPQELIIPVDHFVDLDSNLDIHLSKSYSSSKNKQIAEVLNELFVNLLSRDLLRFKPEIFRFLNSSEKNEFLDDYEIFEERIEEIRNKLNTSFLTPSQKFWKSILYAKEINDIKNIFNGKYINFQILSKSLKIEMNLIDKIQSEFNFHDTSDQGNIILLTKLLNDISLLFKILNENIFPKIDFRDYYQKRLRKQKNNFENKFDSILHNYLSKKDVESQSKYQDYLDNYKLYLDLSIPIDSINLDIEKLLIEKLNHFYFLNLSENDLVENQSNFNSIKLYNKNFSALKSKLTSIRYSKENLEIFLESNKNRSLLYFSNNKYLITSFVDWLKENEEKHKPESEEELTDFLNQYSSIDNSNIEIISTNQTEVKNSSKKNENNGKSGDRFDGGASVNDKKQIGLIAELIVFEKLNASYRNVIWSSKYASKIPKTHVGYNPEGHDGLGYDIEYLDSEGNKYYVEVKGRSDNSESFEISKNEINKALKEGEFYKIIFVSQTMNNGKRRIRDLGNLFLLENGEDFFSNRKFTAIYKNFEIRFQEV